MSESSAHKDDLYLSFEPSMAWNGCDSDSSGGEWDENGCEEVTCVCLFCAKTEESTELALRHILEQHNLDLLALTLKKGN